MRYLEYWAVHCSLIGVATALNRKLKVFCNLMITHRAPSMQIVCLFYNDDHNDRGVFKRLCMLFV